ALSLVLGTAALSAADDGKGKSNNTTTRGTDDHGDRDGCERHGGFEHKGSKWILHNDVLAVWFHVGKEKAKPDLRVVLNGTDDERSGYRVQVLRLCEVPANDTACSHDLPRMNLVQADDWNVVTNTTNDSLTLTMTHAD